MALNTSSQDVRGAGQRVIAFFPDRKDAYTAMEQLKAEGFSSDEIGFMSRNEGENYNNTSSQSQHDESFWDKLKNFFSGDASSGETSNDENVDYRDSAQAFDWDENRADYYYRGMGSGGALVSVTGPRSQEARAILERAGGDLRDSGFDAAQSTRGQAREQNNEDDYRFQLRGEVLRTFKERVQRGEVRVRKEVITENQTVDVPVTREELVVERVPAGGQTTNTGEIGDQKEIRVPLSEERVRVNKDTVVNEEVRVGKRAVQNTERVSDNVRHEELRVDKDGEIEDTGTRPRNKKPAA